MPDITNETALKAAINMLRDSVEAGQMPSGEKLLPNVVELHRQAAARLDALRVEGGQVVTDPTGEGRDVHLSCLLSDSEAWNLAQFFKRAGFSDFRTKAQDNDEAYSMRDAVDKLAVALKDAGYAPR